MIERKAMSDQRIDIRDEQTLLKTTGACQHAKSKAVTIPIPGDEDRDGWIQTYLLADGFYLMNIDIRSEQIPQIAASLAWDRALIINYCFRGRCEVPLADGSYTYLSDGELSIDIGPVKTDFYYPYSEYEGLGLMIQMDADWDTDFRLLGEDFRAPTMLYDEVKDGNPPCAYQVDSPMVKMMRDLRTYMDRHEDRHIVAVKAAEWLMMLAKHQKHLIKIKKTAYTQSQVTIAKGTQKIIMADLSKRHTARELAQRFKVSETSLKTYFRHVYGCGYAAYQHNQRMKQAARLLVTTSQKVSEISTAVGYVSQAKFGKRFKDTYGVTPLEYRRNARLDRYRYIGDVPSDCCRR
jgi:AraC-like DNA-binding protein